MEGTTRKKGIMIVGIGILSLLVAGGIGCGLRSPSEGGDRAWSPWKGRHGFHGKNFPDHILNHIDERVEALNLTEAQKEQYRAIREKVRSDLAAGQEARRHLAARVRKEMEKELPDLHQVASLVSEHAARMPEGLDKGMNRFLEFYEILDDTQKAKVIAHLRDRLKKIPIPSEPTRENARGEVTGRDPGQPTGSDRGAVSLSQQIAKERGDRHGELM